MLRRKHEFKPDRTDSGTLNKLFLTKKQRLSFLKWLLCGIMLVLLSLVQDVAMSRASILGATTDLVCGGILLTCMILNVDQSAVFALCASVFFVFSGSAPGPYSIVLLTGLGVLGNILRHGYLRKGFFATMLCSCTAVMLYELTVFFIGLFVGITTWSRIGIFCLQGLLTVVTLPVLYPVFVSIGKIGGESWKE